MYYSSNNTIVKTPIWWGIDIDNIKSAIEYVMNGLWEKFDEDQGINTSILGYTSEKYNQYEKVYSMTYNNINSIAKNYITANAALDEILRLNKNWNENGANSFSIGLVDKCRVIVNQLVAEPFVCPTACGAIQFEYEKDNGDYLEFEIYEDRIEVYSETLLKGEEEFCLKGICATDKMKQMVVDFYG